MADNNMANSIDDLDEDAIRQLLGSAGASSDEPLETQTNSQEDKSLGNEVSQGELDARDARISELEKAQAPSKDNPDEEIRQLASSMEPKEAPPALTHTPTAPVTPTSSIESATPSEPVTPQPQTNSTPPLFNDNLARLQQLMEERQKAQNRALMWSGISEMGQSLAGKNVPGYKPDASLQKILENQADQPVNNYLTLLKTYKSLMGKQAGPIRRTPVTIIGKDGHPQVVFVDPTNPTDVVGVGNRAYAPNVFTNPETKEKSAFQGGNNSVTTVTGPHVNIKKVAIDEAATPSDVHATLNREQMDHVDKLQKQFTSETKDFKTLQDNLQGIDALLQEAQVNPSAASDLPVRLAKIIAAGRINQAEIERLGNRKGLFNKLQDYANENINGVISADKARDISNTLKSMRSPIATALNNRATSAAKNFTNSYGDYKPEQIAPFIYGNYDNPNNYVTLKAPNGQVAKVKKSEAQKYIDQGAKIVNGQK